MRKCWMSFLLMILFVLTITAQAQIVAWPMRGGGTDNWNSHETKLTQAGIRQNGLREIAPIPLLADPKTNIGDKRGMEAQPLFDTGVVVNGATHDVIVMVTMADVVEVADAYTHQILLQTTLGMPITGSYVVGPNNATIDLYGINDHWGCLATPVIVQHKLYASCQISPDGTGNPLTSRYFMFVVDLGTGKFTSVPYAGMMTTFDGQGAPQDFNAQMRKLRASAAILTYAKHSVVVTCGGSVYMTRPGVTGFCAVFDTVSNTFTDMRAITHGTAGNVWMSGGPVTVMPDNTIYVTTATGGFDGTGEFSESLLRMSYDGKLHLVDHFTPYDDLVRTGQLQPNALTLYRGKATPANPQGMPGMPDLLAGSNPSTGRYGVDDDVPVNGHGMTMPDFKNAKIVYSKNKAGDNVPLVYPNIAACGNGKVERGKVCMADEDLGSAKQTCIAAIGYCVVGGKDGILYSVKATALGNTSLAELRTPKASVYSKLADCVWGTVDPGPVDPCPDNTQDDNFLPWGDTAHIHIAPVPMYDPVRKTWVLFVWGENQQLHEWAISTTGKLTYLAQSVEYASDQVRHQTGGGMTGGGCWGSSNGDLSKGGNPDSALLYCVIPYGDANRTVTAGRLIVFDPIHTGSGTIPNLWDTQRWNIQFTFNKFMQGVTNGGMVVYPDYSGRVLLFQ